MSRRSSSDASASEPDLTPSHGDAPEIGDDTHEYYRRSGFQRAVLALGVLAVMACLAGVAAISWEAVQVAAIPTANVELTTASDEEPQNWLIVGSDSREVIAQNDPKAAVFTGGGEAGGGQRSDTIMIVRVDPKGEHLDILSLQRDLWLPIARTGGNERINSAYGFPDGPQRLIDTIRQDFKIDINHYVEINFASFQGIVEAVGGVSMYFDHPMRDNNSGLMIPESGCRTLDGYQALAFARARHLQYSDGVKWVDDPSGDLGRISRQQFFMRRMFDKAAAKASNPLTMRDLIEIAKQHVKLDQDIEVTKAVAMGQRFGQFRGDSIRSYTLPVSPETTAGGAAVLKMDVAGSGPILNVFRGLPPDDASPETVTFSIENGSGVNGQGGEVQKAFLAIGYKPSGVKDHGTSLATTQIRYAPAAAKTADQLARHLTSGADLVEDSTLGSSKIVLVTGKDFTTVMRRPRDSVTTTGSTPGTTPSSDAAAASASTTTTTTKGQKSTGPKASTSTTSTTEAPGGLNNTGTSVVGVVPGQPPAGVTCD